MTSTITNNRSDTKIIVVGGGPSGACAAKALADRGYTNVNLYEAYPHPDQLARTSSKAYVVALSLRGKKGILDATGLDLFRECGEEGSDVGVVTRHLARHITNNRTRATTAIAKGHPEAPRLIVRRQALTKRLLDAAEESGVTVHYQHRLLGVDFEKRVATFSVAGSGDDSDTKTIDAEWELLLAADGSNSTVRNLMVDNQTIFQDFSARTEADSMEYQVVTLPESPFAEEAFPEGTVHSWNNKELNAIAMGHPVKIGKTADGKQQYKMIVSVVFPEGQLESFRKTSNGYRDPLTKLLPDLFTGPGGADRLRTFEEQLRVNHIATGGTCVWSSSLGKAFTNPENNSTSGVILLGDAAHGMWPSLGQGANCALESVGVFAECLDVLEGEKGDAWIATLVDQYQAARYQDAIAAVDLTYGGIGARESRGRYTAPISYKLQMVGMVLLSKLTLGVVPMPALLRVMMGGESLSYSTARQYNFYYEKYICLGALSALAGTVYVGTRGFPSGLSGAEL